MSVEKVQRAFLDPEVLSRLTRLSLEARQAMQGSVSGRHQSTHRGSSVEFAEYRKYVPGDDPRRLDWRAFGRSDRFYIKEFEADTNLRLCLVLDTSGSMGFGLGGLEKLAYGRRLVATLGAIAMQQGDAVGLACVAGGMLTNIPPSRKPAHLALIYDALEAASAKGDSGLVAVLHELAERTSQRALVVIVSDLFVPTEELKSAFQHLKFSKHDVAVFHLLDPVELSFSLERPTRFVDLESGRAIVAEPLDIAEAYHEALQNYLESVQAIAAASHVDYHRVTLDENYETILARFLLRRL